MKYLKSEKINFLQDSVTDELEIINIFKVLFKSKERLWLWQEDKEDPSHRCIHLCCIRKVDILGYTIWLHPLNQSQFNFENKGNDFFLFSKIKNMAVRFQAREQDLEFISFTMPKQLNTVSEDFSQKLNLFEKENEDDNVHKREMPRKQAKGKQTIRAFREGKEEQYPKIYNLYDISAGGLAIKWDDPGFFKKEDTITIISINGFNLEEPLNGKIVSIREMENEKTFKVGVKFVQKE